MAGMNTKLLEGERALVTGCAGGIGRGIAKALKAEGATVLGTDINAPPTEDGIDFLAGDLSKKDGWRGLLEGAVKKLGSISLFVHAASPRRLEGDTPLTVSEETWDAMTGVNLRSGFFLAREIGRHMRDSRTKGRILLITSLHRDTPRTLAHYSASKAGMTMVMKELARVLAPMASGSTRSHRAPFQAAASRATWTSWWRKSPWAARGLPTTSRRSLSPFCQKDLAVMSWERR